MVATWTRHRFSGGALALDVANTVVLRGDAGGFDRFEDHAEIARFAAAATRFRRSELTGQALGVDDPERVAPIVFKVRETTDRLFRHGASHGVFDGADLARFLTACADGIGASAVRVGQTGRIEAPGPIPLQAATAISALSLLPQDRCSRIRICANCRWLFLDESRNRSRIWCDMAVCGNRQKAKRHYERRRSGMEAGDAG